MNEFLILQTRGHSLGYRYYLYTRTSTGTIYSVVTTYYSNEIDEITRSVNDFIKNNNRNTYCVVGGHYIWVNLLHE